MQVTRRHFLEIPDQALVEGADLEAVVFGVGAEEGVAEVGVFGPIPLEGFRDPGGIGAGHTAEVEEGDEGGCDDFRGFVVAAFQNIDRLLNDRGRDNGPDFNRFGRLHKLLEQSGLRRVIPRQEADDEAGVQCDSGNVEDRSADR